MQSFKSVVLSIPHYWSPILLASALGIAAAGFRAFEPEDSKRKRTEVKRQKELQLLTQKISAYAQTIHQRFPTGDVVVSEHDLADQLRKRPEEVVTALNLLLNQRKVQRAPLGGYSKLNV
jgi:hypothetical protein